MTYLAETEASETLKTHKQSHGPANDRAVKIMGDLMKLAPEDRDEAFDWLEASLRTHKGGDGVPDGTAEKSRRSLSGNAAKKRRSLSDITKEARSKLGEQFGDHLDEVYDLFWEAVEARAMEMSPSAIRTELASEYIHRVNELNAEYGAVINMSEEDVPVVEALFNRSLELESRLAEQIEINAELDQEYEVKQREAIVAEAKEGMTKSDQDKLVVLAEAVEADDAEDFTKKVGVLAESIKKPVVKTGQTVRELLEEADPDNAVLMETSEPTISKNDPMYRYVDAINRTVPSTRESQ